MNLNRLVSLFVKLFAFRALARMMRGTGRRTGSITGRPAPTNQPGASRTQREAIKRARQAARVTRRLGR